MFLGTDVLDDIQKTIKFIVVTPVFEDRESARQLFHQLSQSFSPSPYIVAVEDGSVRDPLRLADISDAGLEGVILHLSRNMGHQRAIAVGLCYTAANFSPSSVVVMDCDGEDQPKSIASLMEQLEKGDCDAVVAQRRKRSESVGFRTFYFIYRMMFRLLTGQQIGFGNFSLLGPLALRRMVSMQEAWVHYAAALMVSRLRLAKVPTDRGRRYAGSTHMNFVSLTLHGLRAVMVFAESVLVRVGLLSVVTAGFASVLLIVAFGLKIFDYATPGWFTTAAGLLLLIVLQSGVLTFVTLMISGLFRSSPPITRAQLDLLIDRVEVSGTQL